MDHLRNQCKQEVSYSAPERSAPLCLRSRLEKDVPITVTAHSDDLGVLIPTGVQRRVSFAHTLQVLNSAYCTLNCTPPHTTQPKPKLGECLQWLLTQCKVLQCKNKSIQCAQKLTTLSFDSSCDVLITVYSWIVNNSKIKATLAFATLKYHSYLFLMVMQRVGQINMIYFQLDVLISWMQI